MLSKAAQVLWFLLSGCMILSPEKSILYYLSLNNGIIFLISAISECLSNSPLTTVFLERSNSSLNLCTGWPSIGDWQGINQQSCWRQYNPIFNYKKLPYSYINLQKSICCSFWTKALITLTFFFVSFKVFRYVICHFESKARKWKKQMTELVAPLIDHSIEVSWRSRCSCWIITSVIGLMSAPYSKAGELHTSPRKAF